jgi:uncharacterized protein (DUF302 family)
MQINREPTNRERPMTYYRTTNVNLPFDAAVTRTRQALAEQGFGVLTEIDMQATLREKRGVQMEPYLILGACNPDLAQRALEIDPAIGALLPCNAVVRQTGPGTSTVTILDPGVLATLGARPELEPMAQEASRRIQIVLDTLGSL